MSIQALRRGWKIFPFSSAKKSVTAFVLCGEEHGKRKPVNSELIFLVDCSDDFIQQNLNRQVFPKAKIIVVTRQPPPRFLMEALGRDIFVLDADYQFSDEVYPKFAFNFLSMSKIDSWMNSYRE
ncbi:Hypothetical protein POVR1_LOCUS84 [uncultured virus]|nr:Hypothetical protein POVR1_LOCUS84 [uncultured virus]